MASDKEGAVASDTEFPDTEPAEKPVRERLRKATISQITGGTVQADSETRGDEVEEQAAGSDSGKNSEASDRSSSPARKRSFEEVDGERARDPKSRSARHHSRKRSRDSTAEEDELNNGQRKISGETARDEAKIATEANGSARHHAEKRAGTPELTADAHGEAQAEAMTSPKTKRSRLHATSADVVGDAAASVPSSKDGSSTDASRADDKPAASLSPTSGFANTSAASPFAALAGSKSPTLSGAQTSTSAFAASGFSALAGSSTSGFGALGKSSGGFGVGGGFGSGKSLSPPPASAPDTEPEKAKTTSSSTFGGSLGQQSAFAAAGSATTAFGSGTPSAFGGKLGQSSGFGSTFGSGGSGFGSLAAGGGLSTFASGKPSAGLPGGIKPAKGFGAPPAADEDEDEGDGEDTGGDDSGFKSPLSQDSDRQDERFYAQELETGEEDETTEYSCRAKLYNFASIGDGKKEWKERGLGVVRLNVKKSTPDVDDSENSKPRARLLMRAEGSHRVILNTPVKKEIRFGAPDGSDPKGGYVYFMGAVDGRTSLELLQLKVRPQIAQELYERISDLQEAM